MVGPDQVEFAHITLPADPAQLHGLRARLRRSLAGLSLERRDEVLLAVAEAAANAVEHAYLGDRTGVIEVSLWTESDALCVQVRDNGRWREPPRPPRPTGHGLGIPLMHRLINCVLIHHDRHGTQVLLRHPITYPAPDQAPPIGHRHPLRTGAHHAPCP